MSRLALDIGGTYLRYILYTPDSILESSRGSSIEIDKTLQDILRRYPDIEGIGISFAGFIKDNQIIDSPNIDKALIDVLNSILQSYKIPIVIENDLNCAAVAEAKYFNSDYLVALYSGTGIGAGIVHRAEVLSGADGFAGEIGHIPYREAPFRCGCGRYDCIENWASGRAISKWVEINRCSTKKLEELYRSADSRCSSIANGYLDALVHACGTLITLCNPQIIVLGGGVVGDNSWLIPIIKERLSEHSLNVSLSRCRVELSRIDNASLQGARVLLDRVLD